MNEIDIGDLHVSYDGQRLTLGRNNPTSIGVSIDSAGVEALHQYLGSVLSAQSRQRQSFRLNREALKGLKVRLGVDGQWRDVQANDFSVTGISLQWLEGEAAELPLMSEVEVSLTLDGSSQIQPALVRRCNAQGLGLFFPNSMRGEHIEPPVELASLLLALQRRALVTQFGLLEP